MLDFQVIEVAGLASSGAGHAHGRLFNEATLHAPVAALIKGATRRQALQIGRLSGYGAQLFDVASSTRGVERNSPCV